MRQYAAEHDITNVIILGDLFHDRVNLNIEVMNAVFDFFVETQREYGQTWSAIPGNHDLFLRNSWNINSIKPIGSWLNAIDTIQRFEMHGTNFWTLPFMHDEQRYLYAVKKIEEKAGKGDVLLTHVGVCGATYDCCFLMQHWTAVNFADSKFSAIFTGHFHCHQSLGEKVHYPGSPISFRFDDGMVPHGFFTYERGKIEFVEIYDACPDSLRERRPPRHVTVLDEDLQTAQKFVGEKVRIILSKKYTANELYDIRKDLIKKGITDVKWVHPKVDEEAKKSVSGVKIDLRNPDAMLATWLSHDKPVDLDVELLTKLNRIINKKAEEQMITAGMDDE